VTKRYSGNGRPKWYRSTTPRVRYSEVMVRVRVRVSRDRFRVAVSRSSLLGLVGLVLGLVDLGIVLGFWL